MTFCRILAIVAAFSAAAVAASCSPRVQSNTRIAHGQCDVSSLAAAFKQPLAYLNQRFCGNVVAVQDERLVKLFPDGELPADRDDIAVLLDSKDQDRIPFAGNATIRVYVEGVLEGERDCFQPTTQTVCVPVSRPLWLKSVVVAQPR